MTKDISGVVLAGSRNAVIGMPRAWEILSAGGTAIEAVEAATRIVEDNELDHSVGYAGLPNVLGEVELDASIMDGERRRVGAVGALKGFRHPISVARAVMEQLPHVFLAGEGAARFAAAIGLEPEELLTDETRAVWQEGVEGRLSSERERYREPLARLAPFIAGQRRVAGTVNVLARDSQGHIACAVSTSGWPWKYPGRIGDSPVVGAGIYADDRYGAVGCTGMGELAIRASLARDLVARLAGGQDLVSAGRAAIADLAGMALEFPNSAVMNAVALDRHGRTAGFSTVGDRPYAVMTKSCAAPQLVPSIHVEWPDVHPPQAGSEIPSSTVEPA
jgi:beta-aspartyl-peptidase (threonine type)